MINLFFLKRIPICILLVLMLFGSFSSSLSAQDKKKKKKKDKKELVQEKASKPERKIIEGYIVALHGDTSYGVLHIQDNFAGQRQIKYIDEFGAEVTYTPDRIKAYGTIEGKDYEVLPTPINFSGLFSDPQIFLLRKIQGPASLYRFYTRRSIFTLKKGDAYIDLIKKPDGSLHEVSYSYKWERIADVLSEYPELVNEIRNDVYKPKDTELILEKYNDWLLSTVLKR